MLPRKLHRYVARLCKLSALLAAGAETWQEEEAFYETVERVLALPVDQETLVWAHIQQTLEAAGGGFTWDWLQDTLEAESTMAVWEVSTRKTPLDVVLFAVPVIYSAGVTPALVGADIPFGRLADVLQDAQELVPDADVALCNRLFSLDDLGARTPGEVARLTGLWAEQFLDEGSAVLQPPREWRLEPPLGLTPHDGIQLFYVLGIAALPDSSQLFPAQGSAPGSVDDGVPWENGFARVLGAAYGIERYPLLTASPAGLYDAIREGAQAARGVSLSQALQFAHLQGLMSPIVTLSPSFDSPGTPGIALEFRSTKAPALRLRHFWSLAYGESPDECLTLLGEQLRAFDIPEEQPFSDSRILGTPSMRLH